MSWAQFIDILIEECGPQLAARVEARANAELGGVRLTVSVKRRITPEQVVEAAPGRPKQAARKLGIHPSTAYRLIKKKPVRIR